MAAGCYAPWVASEGPCCHWRYKHCWFCWYNKTILLPLLVQPTNIVATAVITSKHCCHRWYKHCCHWWYNKPTLVLVHLPQHSVDHTTQTQHLHMHCHNTKHLLSNTNSNQIKKTFSGLKSEAHSWGSTLELLNAKCCCSTEWVKQTQKPTRKRSPKMASSAF